MREIVVFPVSDLDSGDIVAPVIDVSDSEKMVGFSFPRCTSSAPDVWPSEDTTIFMLIEQNVDGGDSWRHLLSCPAKGGIMYEGSKRSEVALAYGVTQLFPGVGRRLRCTLTVTGGPLRSTGTLLLDE
jgi:hypothetical protein